MLAPNRKLRACRYCKRKYYVPSAWPGHCSAKCQDARKNKPNIVKIKRNERKKAAKQLAQLWQYAAEIESKNYKSDIWLRERWDALKMRHFDDQFNRPLLRYIPDLSNSYFQYVVECDGSIHEHPEQISKDKVKDAFFKEHGYQVFRVKAFDEIGMQKVAADIRTLRAIYRFA